MSISFKDQIVSTNTIIGTTNIKIDLEKVFYNLPITPYTFIEKKRGRKRKDVVIDDVVVPNGSIISLKYNKHVRGVLKKTSKNENNSFRNTLTIVMFVNDKICNFKIFSSQLNMPNKTQHPGCKDTFTAQKTLSFIWEYIKPHLNDYYHFTDDNNHLTVILYKVMTNINFNIGFPINRQNLYNEIEKNSMYKSMLEIDFGHTGVLIKHPINEKIVINNIPVLHLSLLNTDCEIEYIDYQTYINTLAEEQKIKENNKKRVVTFIVFHSGKVILSGFDVGYMETPFNLFMEFILKNKNLVQEIGL
jgi:hypothetical protein